MKSQISLLVFGGLLTAAHLASAGDVTEGAILALDRKARTLALTDRSIWPLELMVSSLPGDLKAGDRVRIDYESDEEGISKINEIRLLPAEKPETGAPDVSTGTVLIFDRKANILVLSDRTVWQLELTKSPLPDGLKAGDRVKIEYESDEEGISAISGIERMAE